MGLRELCPLTDLCLDSMSVISCCHTLQIWASLWKYNHFLSNDHIWNYPNLNSPISQTRLVFVFKFSGFSRLINCCQVIEDCKPKIAKVPKFAFSRAGLLNIYTIGKELKWPFIIMWHVHIDFQNKTVYNNGKCPAILSIPLQDFHSYGMAAKNLNSCRYDAYWKDLH